MMQADAEFLSCPRGFAHIGYLHHIAAGCGQWGIGMPRSSWFCHRSSIHLFIHPSHPSIHPPAPPYLHPLIHPPTHPPTPPYINPFIHSHAPICIRVHPCVSTQRPRIATRPHIHPHTHSIQHAAYSIHNTARITRHTAHSTHHTACNTQLSTHRHRYTDTQLTTTFVLLHR